MFKKKVRNFVGTLLKLNQINGSYLLLYIYTYVIIAAIGTNLTEKT